MKICVLQSSSSGNSVYLNVNNRNYLLDAGLSARGMQTRLAQRGINIESIDGIFITHEHYDHVSGLASIAKKYSPTIYLTRKTQKALKESDKEKISPILYKYVKAENEFEIEGLKVLPFSLSHDAQEPVGYRFEYEGKVIAYITDTGVFSAREDLKNADLYILECNHEPDMLMMSGRPWPLIQRIIGDEGHLSNQASAELFSKLMGEKTKNLVLYHLSSECNTKDLALLSYETYFRQKGLSMGNVKITVSDRTVPTEVIDV